MANENLNDENHCELIETAKEIKDITNAQADSDSMIFDPNAKGLSVKIPPDLSKYPKK